MCDQYSCSCMSDCYDQSTDDATAGSPEDDSITPAVDARSSVDADSQDASRSGSGSTSQCGGSSSSVMGGESESTSSHVVMADGSGEGEDVLNLIGDELGLKDKKFMRTVRDINQSPEEFDGTDEGEVAANKTVIANASELSKDAVEYRLTRSDITEDNLGLVKVHEAQIHDGRFGPKSAELTSRGRELLSMLDTQQESVGSVEVDAETVKQLRARVDALENAEVDMDAEDVDGGELLAEVSRLQDEVDEMKSEIRTKIDSVADRVDDLEAAADDEWGMLGEEKASDLDRVIRMNRATAELWSKVLGVNLIGLVESGGVSDEDVEDIQATMFEQLAAAEGRGQATEGSVSDGGSTPAEQEPIAEERSDDGGQGISQPDV